ncbi:VOC family protein [Silvimonas soli]|uniref:VOC family protein n=1 Tax=Silvimonas soli TaxID=2980100 RepID=UPI0024B3A6F3|nr:VOC family protein [Silvimonas soli]
MSTVKPIPDGYQAITPYLISGDASAAIEFYKNAFGAVERLRVHGKDGKIMHAEIEIDGAVFMLTSENPQWNARSPKTIGGSPVSMVLYVTDVDARVAQATQAGAKLQRAVANQFYGDRSGSVEDPDGYSWHISTHVEDVSPEELARRSAEMC